ncbi:MAG: IS66-like element accessory protein TnpA [Janthinobacterium lividum]
MEFITRGDRRRVWAVEQKRAIALESMDPKGAPSDVARRYGISGGLLYTWRRQMMEGQLGSAPQPVAGFARVNLVAEVPQLAAPDPVQPAPDPQPPAAPVRPPCASLIEIGLPGGVSVRVDASVDGVALRRMLDTLEER